MAAAGVLALANLLVHVFAGTTGEIDSRALNGIVLLILAGLVVGHVVRLAREAEARLARAVELESATRERERLARDIHDSVLQVLAMVRRRGAGLGGEAAELARLAGEQETALRTLVGGAPRTRPDGTAGAATGRGRPADGGEADLRPLLTARTSGTVTVSTPATPVPLPEHAARELDAAVAAALDNVVVHCGATARAGCCWRTAATR
ncbi:histidine kinase [Actinomadura sp. CNU-125]|uniref:histidine kinase n=1 Tax=Actinomadura sp. CNU-125 TaxID=1904961 RepID=UPI0021CCCD6C|nr:histidine kinase [Actinomadura sp. CNU-125]